MPRAETPSDKKSSFKADHVQKLKDSKTCTIHRCVVFNPFLFFDATVRSKICSDHHQIQFDVSLYPLLFLANTPFNSDFILKFKYQSMVVCGEPESLL